MVGGLAWLLACGGLVVDSGSGATSPPTQETSTSDGRHPEAAPEGRAAPPSRFGVPVDDDQDGWPVGTDCDDQDPAAYPGAADTWYDGVDSDCAGDSDFDADGDGDDSLDHGGSDCDDAHPYVFGGAEEWCDAVDHDCDGETLAPGVCGKEQDVLALWSREWTVPESYEEPSFHVAGPVPDLDGDGRAEVLAVCGSCTWYEYEAHTSAAYLLQWSAEARSEVLDHDQTHWFYSSDTNLSLNTYGYLKRPPAVDWNGDGVLDLPLSSPDDGFSPGRTWLIEGPVFERPSGSSLFDLAAAAWEVLDGTYYGVQGEAAADLDGDGLSDLITSAYRQDDAGRLFILPGREDAEGWQALQGEPHILGDPDEGGSFGTAFWVLGDLDGDGTEELAVEDYAFDTASDPALFIFNGRDAAGADGELSTELALEKWRWDPSSCITGLGDLDGDGLGEWMVGDGEAAHNGPYSGALHVLSGARQHGWDSEPEEAAVGSWLGPHEEAVLGQGCQVGDFDGDGHQELIFSRVTTEVTIWTADRRLEIVQIPGIPEPAAPMPYGLSIGSTEDEHAVRPDLQPSDIDGDGTEDLLLQFNLSMEQDTIFLLPGWQIPWDDPTWW